MTKKDANKMNFNCIFQGKLYFLTKNSYDIFVWKNLAQPL